MSTDIYTELRQMGANVFGRGPTNEADRLRFLALTVEQRQQVNTRAHEIFTANGRRGRASEIWTQALDQVITYGHWDSVE